MMENIKHMCIGTHAPRKFPSVHCSPWDLLEEQQALSRCVGV